MKYVRIFLVIVILLATVSLIIAGGVFAIEHLNIKMNTDTFFHSFFTIFKLFAALMIPTLGLIGIITLCVNWLYKKGDI